MALLKSNESAFQNVNSQDTSPLFQVIPAELRNAIFELAMTELELSRYRSAYGDADLEDTANNREKAESEQSIAPDDLDPVPSWLRPGCTTRKAVTIALLQTCKRAYLETYLLPVQTKQHTCFLKNGPPDRETTSQYFARLQPGQLACVKNLHIYAQQYMMEDEPLADHFAPVASTLEDLTITLRKCDWWGNEYNNILTIDPYHAGRPRHEDMKNHMEMHRRGETMDFDGWGKAFATLPALKRLTIELEHNEGKTGELQGIVDWAAEFWKFPMAEEDRVLTVQKPAVSGTWLGFEPLPRRRQWRRGPVLRRGPPRGARPMPMVLPITPELEQEPETTKIKQQQMVVWTLVWEPADKGQESSDDAN